MLLIWIKNRKNKRRKGRQKERRGHKTERQADRAKIKQRERNRKKKRLFVPPKQGSHSLVRNCV